MLSEIQRRLMGFPGQIMAFQNDPYNQMQPQQPQASGGETQNATAADVAAPMLSQDQQTVAFDKMGQMGALLLASSQNMTPYQRAQILSQGANVMGGTGEAMYNQAQARLAGTKAQQAQEDLKKRSTFDQRVSADPSILAKLGITPEQYQVLGYDGVQKLIENLAMENTPDKVLDRKYKNTLMEAAQANINKPQLVSTTAPDGSIVQQWVHPGQTQGEIVGTPGPSKSQLKLQEQRDKEAEAAANILPVLQRTRDDYAAAIQKNAVGPYSASGFNRTIANTFGTDAEAARKAYDLDLSNLSALSTAALNKGQGAVSNFERQLYQKRFPGLDSGTPKVGLKALDDMIADAKAKASRSSLAPQPDATAAQQPPQVNQDPIAMARDAIQRGANPELVKRRLVERGINPAGL